MKRLLHSIAAVLLTGGAVFSQNHFCATDYYNQQLVEKDPSLLKDLQQLIANGIAAKSNTDTNVLIIPVVFHVLHQNGIENISDAQIFDAMEVLNRDYRKRNADTALVIPAFDTLISDTRIEFRLASYDPWGNCTNGIDRIYSHETQIGDANCKLNQWDRSKYLNIWVVRAIAGGGVAGYAVFPTHVNGGNYWLDGIVVLHNHVGRIGTGSEFNSRTLTHEAGHWLSLAHPWGPNNNPGIACGDDGVDDTPITKGFTFCPDNAPYTPEDSKVCDTIYENYQNYMDYSYCSYMFTPGQTAVMRHTLRSNDAQRKNLITPETQQSTGVNLTTPPVCVPKVDIRANRQTACLGQNITFTDQSFNGPVTYREWTFQDGNPATSTDANPVVSFNSAGNKTVTLKVGNASGEVTKVFNNYVNILPDWAVFTGPHAYDMENLNYQQLYFINDGDNEAFFQPTNITGYNSSKSLILNIHKNLGNVLPGSQESRYYGNLGGQVDAIVTPSFDLRHTTGVTFSFNYAYATNAVQSTEMTERLKVYYSRDCGNTWVAMGNDAQSTRQGAALATGGFAGNISFVPTSDSDWGTFSRPFNATSSDSRTRFKIEFTASDLSNNLYIDNIMVSGTLGIADDFSSQHDLVIAPNPVVSGNDLHIEYIAGNEPVTFILRNLQGEEIKKIEREEVNQPVSFGFEISEKIAAAYYFLEVRSNSSSTVKKIAVIK